MAAVKAGSFHAQGPARRPFQWRDYIAAAAVVLAIVVSLVGAFIVISHAAAEPPHMRRLTLASFEASGRTA